MTDCSRPWAPFQRHSLRGWRLALLWPFVLLALVGCEALPDRQQRVYSVLGRGTLDNLQDDSANATPPPVAAPEEPATQAPKRRDFYAPGTGQFVREPGSPRRAVPAAGDVQLNFENTNLIEVVRVILGDLLTENYVIDPRVQGAVTLQTSTPLTREDLLPTLELILRMNGAAMVQRASGLHVVPVEDAPRGALRPQLGGGSALPRGYGVRIVPLRFVSAGQIQQILEPLAPPGSVLRVDRDRNLVVLAGTGAELQGLIETIELFDVDWMAGTSVALISPDFVDAKTLAEELGGIFPQDGDGPLAGVVRLTPIERLNALLVITARPEYLRRVRSWVTRLDQETGTAAGQRLFVYRVKNGKAADVAAVLSQVFDAQTSTVAAPSAELAPGLEPVALGGDGALDEPESANTAASSLRLASSGDGLNVSTGQGVRIIADEVNNALVILATTAQYRQIETALRDLDATPLQVLVEVTIAEISLDGELRFGLDWFFKNNFDGKVGRATLSTGAGLVPSLALGSAVTRGFSYALVDGSDIVRGVLTALADDSKLNVVSSPSLLVLNNQQASIQVGDEVPVTTQQQQSTDTNSNVVNSIERRDTGVLLDVTPRVNPGGLVIMEVRQEVSAVDEASAGSLNPTISTREVESTIAVQSGQTIVLGGLISETQSEGQVGIPVLSQLPAVGPLFGTSTDIARRTELVVLITPRAIASAAEANEITREYRNRMESLRPFAQDLRRAQTERELEEALEEVDEALEEAVEAVDSAQNSN